MNKKKVILGSIIVILLSILFHSVYDKFPNNLTALFFPVNESIWEHNKMILLAYFVWTCLEKAFSKSRKSFVFQNFIQLIICILVLDLTFSPFYLYVLDTKDSIVITILWYVVSVLISFVVGEKYFSASESKILEVNFLVGFIMIWSLFAILTFNPIEVPIFYDYANQKYGL